MKDPIDTLQTLISELDQHGKRMKRMRSTDATFLELADTLMPLMLDALGAVHSELLGTRQYLHEEVEPYLADAATEGLLPESAELIQLRLGSYRRLLTEALGTATGDAATQVQTEIEETDKAIQLVTELTLDVEDDPEADEDDPEAGAAQKE